MNKTKSKKEFPEQFLINGEKISDKKSIANAFNNFFINVGPNLATKIDVSDKSCFKSYLGNEVNTRFNFKTVDESAVLKVIQALKPKTSCGYDDLSMKTIKYIAPTILKSLTSIINQSLTTGIFPDRLKIAKVIPLHKKDEEGKEDGGDSASGNNDSGKPAFNFGNGVNFKFKFM